MLLASYERDAIRPHVLGNFKDLLLATARHPAMLYYLDNWESMSPNASIVSGGTVRPTRAELEQRFFARQAAHGLNENYGREVMELHTLGVDGGYTQEDVIAVARCFTGWTVRNPDEPEFVFAQLHARLRREDGAGSHDRGGRRRAGRLAGDRHPGAASFDGKVYFERTGPALRGRRSAAIPGRPHGADVHQNRRRSAGGAGDDVHIAGIFLRRRMAGQGQIAVRNGGERGTGAGRRSDRHVHVWSRRSPTWASRYTTSWSRPDIPKPATAGSAPRALWAA